MKQFTDADVINDGISVDRTDLVDAPMWYHNRGLTETATGYGMRLNSGLKIHFNGRLYRIYVTIFSNVGSSWFMTRGRKVYVR